MHIYLIHNLVLFTQRFWWCKEIIKLQNMAMLNHEMFRGMIILEGKNHKPDRFYHTPKSTSASLYNSIMIIIALINMITTSWWLSLSTKISFLLIAVFLQKKEGKGKKQEKTFLSAKKSLVKKNLRNVRNIPQANIIMFFKLLVFFQQPCHDNHFSHLFLHYCRDNQHYNHITLTIRLNYHHHYYHYSKIT